MGKVKLTDICSPKQWKTIPTEQLTEDGYPVYGANGIIGKYPEYNHEEPVIAITCRGATCGNINVTQEKAYVTGNAMCLDNLRSDVDLKYLFYALRHYDFSTVISGSAQPQITRQGLGKVSIQLIPFEQQRFIAKTLAKIECIISHRLTQLAKLDELVKCRFVELFCRNHNTHNDNLIASLDELIKKNIITYHLDGNHGSDYPRSHEFIEAGGITYISANCILNGHIDFSSAKHLSNERAYKLRKGIAKNGDVLFAHNATVGPVAILETEEERIILGTSLTAYRCNFDYVLPQYLKAYMESEYFVSQYANEMKQTTRNQVPITAQRKYTFIIPPIDIQTTFAAFVRRIDKLRVVAKRKKSFEYCMNK